VSAILMTMNFTKLTIQLRLITTYRENHATIQAFFRIFYNSFRNKFYRRKESYRSIFWCPHG